MLDSFFYYELWTMNYEPQRLGPSYYPQKQGNNCNDQKDVYEAAADVVHKETEYPSDYQDNGD